MPGVGLSITDIRTIYTTLTIGNILKFQGYTVEYLFFFFEWELHTGFLLEGMRKLGRKLLIGEYQSLGEIVMSEGDSNIALQNLRKLAEKDPVLSQYWENVCEVVSNHYQEMFNRCNIEMDVVMAKSLRLNEELKNLNGYYSKPETILSKHDPGCKTIYVFNQKHKYAFEFAKKQYKSIVLCPVGKCEGLEAPADLESIINRAESVMVKKEISDPDELLLAKNLGKSSFILQFNQVNAQTVITFDGITARNHEMHGIYLQYAHARIWGYYDVNVRIQKYLEESNLMQLFPSVNPDWAILLQTPKILGTIQLLDKFDAILAKSVTNPNQLVNYLIALAKNISSNYYHFRVKGEDLQIQKTRWIVYARVLFVLSSGMKILGLSPINKM
ncbi:hypothetical protein HK103_005847 [Boothiomyces macroporosus]|uniref:arginine--tRNA ligase n=1 Tax=Boothiomyces macroporosus TaxID=261099 RepID=A0AAD5UFA2_9FUNG|nr:hypothetical protein HK103_005847 [Boothiomyces macroporosus]